MYSHKLDLLLVCETKISACFRHCSLFFVIFLPAELLVCSDTNVKIRILTQNGRGLRMRLITLLYTTSLFIRMLIIGCDCWICHEIRLRKRNFCMQEEELMRDNCTSGCDQVIHQVLCIGMIAVVYFIDFGSKEKTHLQTKGILICAYTSVCINIFHIKFSINYVLQQHSLLSWVSIPMFWFPYQQELIKVLVHCKVLCPLCWSFQWVIKILWVEIHKNLFQII